MLIGVVSCVSAVAESPRTGTVAEQYLFNAANQERMRRGIPPLTWDETLHRAAQRHAGEMAARESISHQYPGEPALEERGRAAGARFTVIAENVAEAWSAPVIHDAWMESPDHRANLLDRRVTSVGISVQQRHGQLYAVEDFDRSVENLTYEAQENAVMRLLAAEARVLMLPTVEDARRTCEMGTGYSGARKPWFVMRFTTGTLDHLPETLRQRLASGKYHSAAVGACEARDQGAFAPYAIAVMLFP
ncbi:MAG TPA: CAP domain-containing protein [Acidobacteriaceae bacterium]